MRILVGFVCMGMIALVAVVLAAVQLLIKLLPLLVIALLVVVVVRLWEQRRRAPGGGAAAGASATGDAPPGACKRPAAPALGGALGDGAGVDGRRRPSRSVTRSSTPK